MVHVRSYSVAGCTFSLGDCYQPGLTPSRVLEAASTGFLRHSKFYEWKLPSINIDIRAIDTSGLSSVKPHVSHQPRGQHHHALPPVRQKRETETHTDKHKRDTIFMQSIIEPPEGWMYAYASPQLQHEGPSVNLSIQRCSNIKGASCIVVNSVSAYVYCRSQPLADMGCSVPQFESAGRFKSAFAHSVSHHSHHGGCKVGQCFSSLMADVTLQDT